MKINTHKIVQAIFFLAFLSTNISAINYTISFTGGGASSIVGDVIVQNITQNTSITVPAGNTLNLYDGPAAVEQISENDQRICIYPTQGNGKSTIAFYTKQAGTTQVNVFSVIGKKLVGITFDLQTGINTFQLSLPKGTYVINVAGHGYTYNAKLLQNTAAISKPEILFAGTGQPTTSSSQKSKNASLAQTKMLYNAGDQLLYKGFSGKSATIVADVPTGSKTLNYNFVECIDIDGNTYSTVTIGYQTWMVENLKTTHYRDGSVIENVTDNTAWGLLNTGAWNDYSNLATNGAKYGHLYNWYAVSNSRNITPVGWHVPTNIEWSNLTNYLSDRFGTAQSVGKALAANTDWNTYSAAGTIGNNVLLNNSTGFSALPGGNCNSTGFTKLGDNGNWWSATQYDNNNAWYRSMYNYNSSITEGLSTSYYYYYNNKKYGYSVRCVKDNAPTLTTASISATTMSTASAGGNVTDDGGAPITARGICWSKTTAPTTDLTTKTIETGTTGNFISSMTNLTANTKYYVRSYATNSAGTAYGAEVSFTTLSAAVTVTDIDGNIYHTVAIGTQIWMIENLKTTRYRNGNSISKVTNNAAWAALDAGAWCDYANSTDNGTNYGHLYNWYAVNDSRKIAPAGWHVATDVEWNTLITYLGGQNVAGGKLKEAGMLNWASTSSSITNSSGFTALPGGYRTYGGTYFYVGTQGNWWTGSWATTSNATGISMNENSTVNTFSTSMLNGASVRCIKD